MKTFVLSAAAVFGVAMILSAVLVLVMEHQRYTNSVYGAHYGGWR